MNAPLIGDRKEAAVTIRMANAEADVDSFVELAREAHQESRHKNVPYDPEGRRKVWRERIVEGKGNFVVLLASYEQRDIGILIATIGSYLFTDALQAQCYSLYVCSENRNGTAAVKLLHAFHRWAEAQGAASATVHVTSGVRMESTDKLLRRVGFEQTGGNYEILLDPSARSGKAETA